jgi:PAS domain S-box-containing protein
LLVTIGQLIEAARIQAENTRIQRELTRLSRVASETTNGVIITNARGEIDWINDGFTRITGYRLEEVRGLRPGHFLQGPDTDLGTVAHMRRALKAGQGFRVDLLNYAKSGALLGRRELQRPARQRRRAAGLHGHRDRHHREQARRAGPDPGAHRGGGGEPLEERVPGEHEPRDQDADERGAGDVAPAAADAAGQEADGL